jgi:PBSX family phage terminase large subunit
MLRCSGDNARIFWDCNPSHPLHTVKIDYIDKSGDLLLNGRLNIKSWHFKLEDNAKENEGFLNPEYIESIKKTTPTGYLYDRDIEGLWVAAEGMIYKDFNPDIHFIDKIDNVNIIEYIAGVDWGFKHLGTIVACGISDIGNYYILEEISEYEKGIDYWINEAKKLKEKYHSNIIFYCDSARVDNISAFKNAGIMAKESKKDVIEGISFVATLFKENRIKIVKNKMKYFKDNIYNYLWKDGLKEEPIKENDDILDAIRYMCFTHSISRRVIKNPQISATSLGL